jgi:N6-L-threonylcarbamoyladenine synthase
VAKSIAYARALPLVGVNHLEGHVYAAFLDAAPPSFPFLALVVSGGHTALYVARARGRYQRIGQTRDDAAGEAFDKVAKLLGSGSRARQSSGSAPQVPTIAFPRADGDGAPTSFSGIKTAVSLHVPGGRRSTRAVTISPHHSGDGGEASCDYRAGGVRSASTACATGGVAANTALREALEGECREHGWALHVPSRGFCTDNAAMIAAAGHDRLEAGERAPPTMNAVPDLVRG